MAIVTFGAILTQLLGWAPREVEQAGTLVIRRKVEQA